MTKTSLFQLIDLDRTLFDTAKYAKLINDKVNEIEPGLGDELEARVEESYKAEETFFLLRYLRERMGDSWFEAMVGEIIDEHGAATFLLPGASERIAFAESFSEGEPSWGILTYGDEVDQLMKCRIVGLASAPIYLTETADKGLVVSSWQHEDGMFHLPQSLGGVVVESLTLEDDKFRAFQNLPDGVIAIWLTDETRIKGHQDAEMLGIHPVKDLYESIEYLKKTLL